MTTTRPQPRVPLLAVIIAIVGLLTAAAGIWCLFSDATTKMTAYQATLSHKTTGGRDVGCPGGGQAITVTGKLGYVGGPSAAFHANWAMDGHTYEKAYNGCAQSQKNGDHITVWSDGKTASFSKPAETLAVDIFITLFGSGLLAFGLGGAVYSVRQDRAKAKTA